MKTRIFNVLGVLMMASFFLAGCASSAYIEKDDTTDFSKYHTYSWIQKKEDKKKATDFADQKVRNAVNMQLQKEGWTQVSTNPDLLLSYDVLVERNVKQETQPVYTRPYSRVYYNPYTRRYGTIYYPSQFLGYDSYDTPIKEGTLTLTIVDAKTDKTVWQGWTTDEVNSNKMTSKEIEAGVKSILRKFDVASN